MNIYTQSHTAQSLPAHPRSVILGVFDGMHCGHRAVVLQGKRQQGVCCVYTFLPETMDTKSGGGRLCDDREQLELLETCGVDEWIRVDFATIRDYTPEMFVQRVLCEQLHATAVTCGFNYRFGRHGAGDVTQLTALCAAKGISVMVVPPVEVEGLPVSSTRIRDAIRAGDMDTARRLLGRNYSLRLPVIDGQHLGRRLDWPTINQLLPTDRVLPAFGVYASCVVVDGQVHPAVTNIGRRPTVGSDAPLAETWIADFEGDLYGQTVAIYPLRYLRAEKAFPSLSALQTQIQADVAAARALFDPPAQPTTRAVLFDFDDTLHDRDAAFLRGLNKLLSHYMPDWSEEVRQARAQEMLVFNRHGYHCQVDFPTFLQHFLDKWHIPTTVDEALAYFFLQYAASCQLDDDVLPTITALRARGYRIGVLTNGFPFSQNAKLDLTGLRPWLDIGMVSGDEGVQKPNPEVFRRCAAKLGVPCACCVYVGDYPANDVYGALEAGMQAIWRDPQLSPDHPCYDHSIPPHVPTIHRIQELLERLP